jgi:hypothetical protein
MMTLTLPAISMAVDCDPSEIAAALKERDFEAFLTPAGALAVADLLQQGKRYSRQIPPWLAEALWDNADAVARGLHETSAPPPDSGAPLDCPPDCWATAVKSSERFIIDGWAIMAVEFGWSADELFRTPLVWGRVDLCGVALLIGDGRKVIEVTADAITIETPSRSRLKFRRSGRGARARAQMAAGHSAARLGCLVFEIACEINVVAGASSRVPEQTVEDALFTVTAEIRDPLADSQKQLGEPMQ